ncbi:uncharacterized protein LOC142795623 [Rhipicephalus microplus]|uniref:uncharacterized protein LOC142795623 n=1 Tax=Rhipicephalus microplus TaxID=6941 RepID=UPI003F6AF8D3
MKKKCDEHVAPGSEIIRPLTGAMESSSRLEVRELSALRDGTAAEHVEKQLPNDGTSPKEERRVSSEELALSSPSIEPEYDAAMTPFQRKVVNVTFCFSLSVIGAAALLLVVVALTHRVKHLADGSQECESQQCLDATHYLQSVVERDLHPCVDMYSHVCNRWTSRRRGVGFLPDALRSFLQHFVRRLQSAREDVLGEPMASVIHIGKHLFEDCSTYMNALGSSTLQADIASVLEHVNTSVLLESDSLITALVRAISISFATGLHSAVLVTRKKDDSNTYLHFVNTPPIRRVLRAPPADDDIEPYIRDVIRHVSSNPDAAVIARDVLDVDSEVDTFIEGFVSSVWIGAGELKKDAGFPSGVWRQAFASFADQGLPVTDADVNLFTGYEQTRKLFKHLNEIRLRTTAWYLTITIIAQALRYEFARRFHPTDGHDITHICFDAVNDALHLHWHYVWRELSITQPVTRISQLMNSVFLSVHQLTVPAWFDEATASQAHGRVNRTLLETLAPSAGDVANANTTYLQKGLRPSSAARAQISFPAKYVLFRTLSQREAVLRSPPHWVAARAASLWAELWPVFDVVYDKILLPAAYLHSPVFYNEPSALPFLYGTVGAAMAKALADVVGPYSRLVMAAMIV